MQVAIPSSFSWSDVTLASTGRILLVSWTYSGLDVFWTGSILLLCWTPSGLDVFWAGRILLLWWPGIRCCGLLFHAGGWYPRVGGRPAQALEGVHLSHKCLNDGRSGLVVRWDVCYAGFVVRDGGLDLNSLHES